MDSITLELVPSLGLRSTGLYFLGTYWLGYRSGVEFPVPLLPLLQLQSYLAPFISARVSIIPKLQNIYWRKSICEPFSLCIEHLPNCYFVRRDIFSLLLDMTFREHFCHALPTEMIFYLLRSTPSESLCYYSGESMPYMLEIIIKWLQVSVSECNRQSPRNKI